MPQPYHDPDDEPIADPIDPSFFDFDNGEPLKKEELKGMPTFRYHETSLLSRTTVLIYREITTAQSSQSSLLLSADA